MSEQKFTNLPQHVAIIMDGNGRWAKKRGLPRTDGHIEGAKNFRRIADYAGNIGIKHLTFYAFSTENWARPEAEVKALMEIFSDYMDEAIERLTENEEKGIRLRFLGDKSRMDPALAQMMEKLEDITKHRTRINLNIALNYGSQQEILAAVKSIASDVRAGALEPDSITLQTVEDRLYTAGQPPVDLMIRPSGEQRISNFLLWQSAYAEFWYSNVLWPDFSEADLDEALFDYEKRNRRFGKV